MNPMPVTEAELHAYVDGCLSDARREEVAQYLAAHPEDRARIQAYREQNEALRALFAPVLDEAVPPRISASVTSPPMQIAYARIAAGLLIAVAGGTCGWLLRGATQPLDLLARGASGAEQSMHATTTAALARDAAIAHLVYTPDTRRPVEIGAEQEEQLVKWLSKRTGADMHPPKLGKLGYELIGGRLLPGESSSPVAQFMYQDAVGRRLTLYVSTDQAKNSDTGFRFARQGEVNVFYWIDGRFGYALSAAVDKGELARVAHAVYEQLNDRMSDRMSNQPQ